MTRMAKLGRARPTLETLMASAPPRPVWPSQMPRGRASAAATSTLATDMVTCSPRRWTTPASPLQCEPVVNQRTTSPKNPTSGRPPGPRGEQALDAGQAHVGDHGEGDGQHRADDQRRAEVPGQPVEDQLAQPALADQGGNLDQAD